MPLGTSRRWRRTPTRERDDRCRRARGSGARPHCRCSFATPRPGNGPTSPGHALLGAGDQPKAPTRVPRFIPADELEPLIAAIAELQCPQQRAALLVARWCGARQGEIRRLAIDCLDRYPDQTPRLRLPAGKTYRERTVPLHEQAAEALRAVIALRYAGGERAFTDELTGHDTRYLFMRHGKLLSFATCSKPRSSAPVPRPTSSTPPAGRRSAVTASATPSARNSPSAAPGCRRS
jgi:integrase